MKGEQISNEQKSQEIANSYRDIDMNTLDVYCAIADSTMEMAEFKDEQYLSAKFITKVLRMADKFSDRRIIPAVAAQIAHELRENAAD